MHIAAARKRKVVALFGPTVRQFGFFPFGTASTVVEHPTLPCRPCTHIGLPDCPRGHFRCMRDLESGTVIHAATELLENDFAKVMSRTHNAPLLGIPLRSPSSFRSSG